MFTPEQLADVDRLLHLWHRDITACWVLATVFDPGLQWVHEQILAEMEESDPPLDSDIAQHSLRVHQVMWAKGFFMGIVLQRLYPCAELEPLIGSLERD
tara:strand:- start:30 stop:326 length:297 start_codon:yes stop_codon:yes gene_type:complete